MTPEKTAYRGIYEIVMRIPRGRVASYGRIARMAGCGARQVGYAMAAAPPGARIPWHRVINSKGEISARKEGGNGGESRQRDKLLREGVVFDRNGRVDFARFGWGAEEFAPPRDGEGGGAPRIIVCCGDPAGIGPDIALRAAPEMAKRARIVLLGDRNVLAARAKLLGIRAEFSDYKKENESEKDGGPREFRVLHMRCGTRVTPGKLRESAAAHAVACMDRATDLCLAGEFDAMTTGPVNKAVINRAGIAFTGHTERIAARCGARAPVMMLAGGGMRVCLLTAHLPLREVRRHVTAARIERAAEVIVKDLRGMFGIESPALGVCGLNPHAGEDGCLGDEEIKIIAPALQKLRARGFDIRGPLPADTAFTRARLAGLDAVLAMYHDQALPVVKHAAFGGAVNITLGLPIIRTSVDHGTAAELSGKTQKEGAAADPSSMRAALELAAELARARPALQLRS